ncbi:MAG: DUF1292 domain-containing protein [Clostridia bacterium]|nr:DUF1292 domain-containing protein [Clostridia bacterium]
MANEKQNNEEDEIFTLTDENGDESDFALIGSHEQDGVMYVALMPVNDNENAEYVILRVDQEPDSGEEILVTIDDDDEFDRIADIFDDILFDD